MKLSCLPVSLYSDLTVGRQTPGGWFRLAARLGLDGADLSVAHVTNRAPAYLSGLRHEAREAGVQIAMLALYSDFTHPDAAERRRQVDDVRAWIEAATRLGVTFLRLTAGQGHAGVVEAVGLAWAVQGLTACLEEAVAANVRLLYENHVRGAIWRNNDFTQPAERFLEVVHRTAGTKLGILFDTANCLALGDAPLAVLQRVSERVGAVHVSDIQRVGAFEPTVIGAGVAPITQALRMMVTRGFDGWISIEEASRTGEEGFRRAVTFTDRAWQEAGGRPRRVDYERAQPRADVANISAGVAPPSAANVDERLESLLETGDASSVEEEGRAHVRPTQLRAD